MTVVNLALKQGVVAVESGRRDWNIPVTRWWLSVYACLLILLVVASLLPWHRQRWMVWAMVLVTFIIPSAWEWVRRDRV